MLAGGVFEGRHAGKFLLLMIERRGKCVCHQWQSMGAHGPSEIPTSRPGTDRG